MSVAAPPPLPRSSSGSFPAPLPNPAPPRLEMGGAPASTWTTPKRLQVSLGAIWIAAFLLFLAVFLGTRQHYAAIKAVGLDAAPSIVAAQRIKAGLADMDANVANELIAPPGRGAESEKGYNARRLEVSQTLVKAAENITYGDAERVPIQTLTYNLGNYEALVAQARLLHGRGGDTQTLTLYRQANLLMHQTLLPAADALDKANADPLADAYGRQKTASAGTRGVVWAAGLLLLTILLATQVWLSRRTRRTLNPLLLAATALGFVFLALTVGRLGEASGHLKVAKEDAFDSIHALWQARAVAYDANADESRWLIDRSHAREYQEAFFQKSAQIAAIPEGYTYTTVAASSQSLPPGFHGFLADELRNVTFPGEQDEATGVLRDYGQYAAIDGQVRSLENAGHSAEAVALCTGYAPGQSNEAYGRFDDALGRTLDINQKAFDGAVGAAFADLSALPILAPVAMLALALLSWLGLRPRLREYEA